MEKKILIIGEILFIIVASVFYIVKEIIPEYKKEFGSSDSLIKTDYYKNMIEFNIDNTINFSVILNEDKEIYHIFFFDKNSLCLYNKNIENKKIDTALLEIVTILIKNNYLMRDSITMITKYDDYYYEEFLNDLYSIFKRYNLDTNFIEKSSSLKDKSYELKLNSYESQAVILRDMDYYSKEFSRTLNNVSNGDSREINEGNSRKYTDRVYKKIEEYIRENNIKSLKKDNTELVINLIPFDDNLKYYPSSSSWYYVRDSKVYAYIEIEKDNQRYGYCYKGSIDFNTKGEC